MESWQPETISFAGGGAAPGSGYTENFGGTFATLRLTSILSNNLVNEAHGSYVRITATTVPTYTVQACCRRHNTCRCQRTCHRNAVQ